MDTRIRTQQNRSINARGASRMPRPVVQSLVVQQPMSLRPMGNTIALTVPAEMPFTGRSVSVRTQVSGGMTRPDRMMQSKKITFDGLGGLGADLARSKMTREQAHAISWGDQTGLSQATINEADAVEAKTMLAADDPEPGEGFSWSKAGDIFSTVVKSGADVYGQIQQAKNANQPTAQPTIITRTVQNAKSNMPIIIVAGVAIVGLVAFMMLRKKGAATAA